MAVIFIFIDGVGIGDPGGQNPFSKQVYPSFEKLTGGKFIKGAKPKVEKTHLFKPIDANLGVEGLPQSGTGQTALFTGKNAAKEIGKHFGPYPHSGIKPFLKTESIFHGVKELGKKPYFINAYPPIFFKRSEDRNRWTCTTLMAKSAGVKLNSTEEILAEKALTAEIVQTAWREKLGIDIPEITPAEGAKRMLNVAKEYEMVLFEYYLTDKAGHKQNHDFAQKVLTTLDEFLMYLINNMSESDTLIITSDHGNLEDLSTKTHTRNNVPLFVLGESAQSFDKVENLTDLKDVLLMSIEKRNEKS